MDFKIHSNFFKIYLWIVLTLVLALDLLSLWSMYTSNVNLPFIPKSIMFIGIAIKLGILYCLATSNGPLKSLLYVWGGLFIVSGAMGLLSFILSNEVEPIQNYLDKGLFLVVGLTLVIPASLYISINEQNEA